MKPLTGKRIVVTRPAGQAAPFIGKITEAGGTAYAVPLIAFQPARGRDDTHILRNLDTYDWLVFTSKNGVDFFMEKAGSCLGRMKARIAAVGVKTAAHLKKRGIPVSYVPPSFSGDAVAADIKKGMFQPGKALIVKGNLSRNVIGQAVRQAGGQADEWIVYETYFPEEQKKQLLRLVRTNSISMYTFMSPSAVTHFVRALEAAGEPLPAADYAVIGPVTEKTAAALGVPVSVSPDVYTMEALLEHMIAFYKE